MTMTTCRRRSAEQHEAGAGAARARYRERAGGSSVPPAASPRSASFAQARKLQPAWRAAASSSRLATTVAVASRMRTIMPVLCAPGRRAGSAIAPDAAARQTLSVRCSHHHRHQHQQHDGNALMPALATERPLPEVARSPGRTGGRSQSEHRTRPNAACTHPRSSSWRRMPLPRRIVAQKQNPATATRRGTCARRGWNRWIRWNYRLQRQPGDAPTWGVLVSPTRAPGATRP